MVQAITINVNLVNYFYRRSSFQLLRRSTHIVLKRNVFFPHCQHFDIIISIFQLKMKMKMKIELNRLLTQHSTKQVFNFACNVIRLFIFFFFYFTRHSLQTAIAQKSNCIFDLKMQISLNLIIECFHLSSLFDFIFNFSQDGRR